MPRRRRGRPCSTDSTPPPWWGRLATQGGGAPSPTGCPSTPRGRSPSLARAQRTTVNTVLQAAWAQLLTWLTGHHDVAFGTAVSGRPADLPGAESLVGLMISTVPVRANITAATTVADLLDQLQCAHNDTVEHEHLALNEIHRATGHDGLFDTLFVYENYPIDPGAMLGVQELAVTEFTSREFNHYPLSVVAMPGQECGPARRIRHRRIRRVQHRDPGRSAGARADGHGCRSHTAVVVDRSARFR